MTQMNGTLPEKVISQLDMRDDLNLRMRTSINDIIAAAKPLLIANGIPVLSSIYSIDPLFPVPCELVSFGALPSRRCGFYISEDAYECAYDDREDDRETSGSGGPLVSFDKKMPEYWKITSDAFFFHLMLLVIILYVLLSLAGVLIPKAAVLSKKAKILIFIPIMLLLLWSTTFESFRLQASMLTVLAIIAFILVMVKQEWKERAKSMLFIAFVVLILSSYFGLYILANSPIMNGINRSDAQFSTRYLSIYCENAKMMTPEEMMKRGFSKDVASEEWNICFDPDCRSICEDESRPEENIIYDIPLRGNFPSCVCGFTTAEP
jgi:hypothetical protein